ncbi:Eisosomes component [Elasticomyces elasticus]|nr:Eisosomes component [Elasticomyces elasticus]
MAAARPILGLVSLVILAGGILLQLLVILSGAVAGNPLDLVYFLEATTNGIKGARNPTRWTFFSICGVVNGRNGNCGAIVPALPFDPPRNFGTTSGIPAPFIGTHTFYYLSRFMFAFYLVALFFAAIALFTGLLALFSRIGAFLSGFNTMVALFFQTLTATLMTAWTVLGRNAFNANGQTATLGNYAYGFTWAAMACFLISTILFCAGGATGKNDTYQKKSYFGRKRSTRSRGSFIDNESQRRVKDEYD